MPTPHPPAFYDDLLSRMTLEEKVALLAGTDMWYTVPIPRLGIPSLKFTDGPNGARGSGSAAAGVASTCFPAEIALAATWNPALVERVGLALADEARLKGAQVLLAPMVNIQRAPLAGRNFECFSEDPHLTARLAVAYITGLQRGGVGASIKHYVCNDQEYQRTTISAEVHERALREVYLAPFAAAVREADPWTVMAAYNLVNGVPASEHRRLLTDVLRGEWGFAGVVISDWFDSVKSTAASLNAGLDLEMPDPHWRGPRLLEAVQQGAVAAETLDASVRRLLRLLDRADLLAHPATHEERAPDLPERRALAREAAAEGIVLLKNDGDTLPLQRERLTTLAMIGPTARVAHIMGGGSAQVAASYAVTPYDGIAAKLGDAVRLGYEQGCTNHRLPPLPDADLLLAGAEGSEHGVALTFYDGADFTAPIERETQPSTERLWFGHFPGGANPERFAARASARFTPRVSGDHTFALLSLGRSRLLIAGREVIDNWTRPATANGFLGLPTVEAEAVVPLEAGREYPLTLEFAATMPPPAGFRLGVLPPAPAPAEAIERAVRLAAASDAAIVCAGFGGDWQSEGFDRPNLDLPGQQNELIERVAAANPRTIVVLNTGSPITMPWLPRVAAVAQAWYPGQECGNAIADVLFGDITPSGKLPQTFPRRLEDTPTYRSFPGENGKVHYDEGLFVGYRSYDRTRTAPLFPFGFGLSYTTFSYGPLRLSAQRIAPTDTLRLAVDITNTGPRAGQEVVQLYVRDVRARLERPEKELKGFAKVPLQPGETRTVTLTLGRDALAYYDDGAGAWVAEAGEFQLLVGASAQDIRSAATFTLTETATWR